MTPLKPQHITKVKGRVVRWKHSMYTWLATRKDRKEIEVNISRSLKTYLVQMNLKRICVYTLNKKVSTSLSQQHHDTLETPTHCKGKRTNVRWKHSTYTWLATRKDKKENEVNIPMSLETYLVHINLKYIHVYTLNKKVSTPFSQQHHNTLETPTHCKGKKGE